MDRHNHTTRAGSRGCLAVFCFAFFAARVFAAGVEPDGATSTTLDTAQNGIPVVNIANPNSRGLSHNSYNRFDVGSPGLILNNATQNIVGTRLGGQIFGNPGLDAPARLILNEVTGANRSVLNGYTEVAGQGADVVIANPNGISVNGAGFINAPRVTLTTGVPSIDGPGNLAGFNVGGGDITIDGAGLDTGLQDATSIYAHFLNLNAKLHAQDLDIALGRNHIDYPGRKIVSRGRGSSGRLLLDSSALGGMYANKIVLVGTEKGPGMNLPPEVIASGGDIQVSSDGRLVLHKIDAGGQIRLQAGQGIDSDATVFAAGDIAIAAGAALAIESGMIASSGEIAIQANRVSNDGALIAGLGADGQMNDRGNIGVLAGELSNRGEIISTGALAVNAIDFGNQGLISAAADLTLTADTLVNEATLFSAGNARLLVRNDLGNQAGASIFSRNNLLLAADLQFDKTGNITNELGLIQSLRGDIDIHAARFENTGVADLDYELIYYDLGNGREAGSLGAAMTINLAYDSGYTKHNHEARNRWIREVLDRLERQAPLLYQANAGSISNYLWARFPAIETRLVDHSTSTPAYLDSGGDLNLDVGLFINQDSVTAAARDINFGISEDYRNVASSVTESVVDYQYFTRAHHSRRKWTSEDKYSSHGSSYYLPVARSETVSANTVTHAGRTIDGAIGGQAVNAGVLDGSYQPASEIDPSEFTAASVVLPSNDFGLFVKSTAPDSRYLVETNPRFADLGGFVNSGYLLDRLDYSGSATLKRLGDGFYEAKLIRDSVFAQSGRRYLDADIHSDNQQFQYLMDNALVAQRELELSPGVTLTRDQINRLNRDIVWLEAIEVAGQAVLAPRVYLANGPKSEVRGGRIIAGGDTRLRVASLVNDGLVESGNDFALDADDRVDNRGMIVAAESLRLGADHDIENRSGRIAGRDVEIRSRAGSIVNRRDTADYDYGREGVSFSTRVLGEAGVIQAEGSLTLDAAERVRVEGSELSGGNVAVNAKTLEVVATSKSEDFFSGNSDNHVRESTTRHFASKVNGDDILILAVGAAKVSGSKIAATRDLRLGAGDIVVDAVNDSDYAESLDTLDKALGESLNNRRSFRGRNVASEISAATVVLVTEHGDIELTASELNAQTRLAMISAGDIRVVAGNDESLDEQYTRDSGWFSGGSLYSESEDLEGRITRSAVGSRLAAGTIDLDAAADIELEGADIVAAGQFTASGRNIAVRNAGNEDTRYSRHTEISVGFDDLASNLGNLDDLIEEQDGKLKLKLADARYEHAESVSTRSEVVESRIRSGGSIHIDARQENSGDITIEGSDLAAADAIELDATGAVALLDAHQGYTSDSLTRSGSAALSVTLQNEYDQAARSIEAIRQAEQDLQHARDDYDRYRQDLLAREKDLVQLRQQLASGKGFIEQADIEDFERHLVRMRNDDEFYQTNIALAAVTLTSQTTALVKQTGRAAASSGTFGFNAGLELDIHALEQRVEALHQQSRESNLDANRVAIRAGASARVRGSILSADGTIEVSAVDIEILAGASTESGRDSSQHVNYTHTWDLLGNGGPGLDENELGGSIAAEGSRAENESTQHANSWLLAGHIRLDASRDTRIRGADMHASEHLEITTGDLDVASVQDIGFSQTRSAGLSHASAGGGIDAGEARDETVQTQLTRLTGPQVDIAVAGQTRLQGAVIASVDADGTDNGRLALATSTLNAGSLNNTTDDSNRSIGIHGGEFSSLDYQDDLENHKTKSLATIGSGNLQIDNIDSSDLRLLNFDIENTEVSIYDIESHQGMAGELDTRLLTEDGRKQIVEDWLKTGMIGNTIELIVTTERVGLEDFFAETDKYYRTYEAIRQQVANDPVLAAMLQNSGLTPAQKQQMLNQVTGGVMEELGYVAHDNLIIATDRKTPAGSRFYGFFSKESDNAYINDTEHNSTRDLLTTAGHEASHAIDSQSDVENSGWNDRYDNNIYANNFGENIASYTDFTLDFQGYGGLASSNEHLGNDQQLVIASTINFDSSDKEKGDFRLSELQEENRKRELDRCVTFICSRLVEGQYAFISSIQGVSESVGVVAGAVTQVMDDLDEFIRIVDELIEDPEKAEQAAEKLDAALFRANEIIEGDSLSESEKYQFANAVNDFAYQVINSVDDARLLDGEGFQASYGEGRKYGVYAASFLPLRKISKFIRPTSAKSDGVTLNDTKGSVRFYVDSEAGAYDQAGNRRLFDYKKLSSLTGLPPDKLEEIVRTPWGNRPKPEGYMSKSVIDSHLSKFDQGAIRFIRKSDIEKYGTIGPPSGAFVMPKSEFDDLLNSANGNLLQVEKKLGLKTGALTKGEISAIYIEPQDIKNLRLPSGNEAGINGNWVPGGKTQGGISEAIIDVPSNLNFTPLKF